jgi:hypothetical protein
MTRTPRITDSDIRALIKKYPIQLQLDMEAVIKEHKKRVRRDGETLK